MWDEGINDPLQLEGSFNVFQEDTWTRINGRVGWRRITNATERLVVHRDGTTIWQKSKIPEGSWLFQKYDYEKRVVHYEIVIAPMKGKNLPEGLEDSEAWEEWHFHQMGDKNFRVLTEQQQLLEKESRTRSGKKWRSHN